jgi:hypothetical protein
VLLGALVSDPEKTHAESRKSKSAAKRPANNHQDHEWTPPPAPRPEPRRELVLKPNWTVTGEEGGYVKVKGRVVNKMGRDLRYVQIQFNCYDKSGAQVDTVWTNTTNLEAGGTWKFEGTGFRGDEVANVKLAALSGW